MDTARWERIQALFHGAADLPEGEQRAHVEREAGGDVALVEDVLNLLAEDLRGSSMLDRDVAHVAQQMLGAESSHVLPSGQFGPYRIDSVLGEGGMGVVYLATRDDLGSVAAIKILRDAWLSPARRERFASEQRTLAQLNHPSIARLYDADTLADGTPWFVMEYVEGLPLTRYCDEHGLSVRERLGIFRDVCEAVQHAHRHLVIHRDLKPSNILVRGDGTVKLLDFGISKQLESLDLPADQTQTGLRLMTPAYAAPEQIRAGRVGIHTDVYSLGVVLYELLSGRLPFDLSNRTPSEAEDVIVHQDPDRPSAAAAESGRAASASRRSWADLDVMILTAMHKDPQRRYRTVEALVRDIDHYLRAQPLEARADSLGYRAGKFVRRNWRVVSTTAAVVAVMVAMGVFYTVRLTTARNAALAEAERAQRLQAFMRNLFEGGDESVGPADSLRVVTLVDRGVQTARALSSEPALQAELYETLGDLSRKLGNFERADSLLGAALTQRRRLFGESHPDVVASLVSLARLRDDQAKFDSAQQLLSTALEIGHRILPPSHPMIAEATTSLGQVYENRGTYDSAVAVLTRAVGLYSLKPDTTAELAFSMGELANSHFYLGHLDTFDSLVNIVLGMNRRLHGDRHPLVADALINLGASQFERGNFPAAERFYRDALAINRPWYGERHPETASTLTMLGRALVAESRPRDAAEMLTEALAINERVYGAVHPRVASTLNELGSIALSEGNLDDAEARYRRMLAIYREVYHNKHWLIGVATSNLGGVYTRRKNFARAEQFFRDALQAYAGTLPPTHQNAGITRIRLGDALMRQGRFAEAEKETVAGYAIVSKQAAKSTRWLQPARENLALIYDSLGQPQNAQKFRAEFAAAEKKPTSATTAK